MHIKEALKQHFTSTVIKLLTALGKYRSLRFHRPALASSGGLVEVNPSGWQGREGSGLGAGGPRYPRSQGTRPHSSTARDLTALEPGGAATGNLAAGASAPRTGGPAPVPASGPGAGKVASVPTDGTFRIIVAPGFS